MPQRPLSAWPRPSVTVDLVILTILDSDLKALLVRRGRPPFEGQLALPGGFVRVGEAPDAQGEDLIEAARRELAEETGLPEGAVYLDQLGAFGAAGRDPRGRVITVAYYALVRSSLAPLVQAGGDAASAGWRSVARLDRAELAFDHGEILDAALARVRERLDSSHIAFELVPETFTVTELRAVHEVLRGAPQDPANFRRSFNRMLTDGLLEQAPGKRITGARRASVYRYVGAPTPRAH